MNTLRLLFLLAGLFASAASARIEAEQTSPLPIDNALQDARGLGDILWTMALDPITGQVTHLGCEFDGTNYWVTSPGGFTDPRLYEIAPDGTLVNSFPQPAANVGFWGWRDLTWDGQYLYASSESDHPGYIAQIDRTDGQCTGVYFGPYPLSLSRALAYDPVEDCFWTGSFTGPLYKCFKDGTYQIYPNQGYNIYAAAAEHATPVTRIWWWTQDGGAAMTREMLTDGTFTGRAFKGFAIGAGAYDAGGGAWEMVGLEQGAPDRLIGYDLDTSGTFLVADKAELSVWYGGTIKFYLHGPGLAGRSYALFGTMAGQVPGTVLPGGLTLPLNWDWFSAMLLQLAMMGSPLVSDFIGVLEVEDEADGYGEAALTVPGHFQFYQDFDMHFAWCTYDPFDFVSNPVKVVLKGLEGGVWHFQYDDGTSEDALGWTDGGDAVWMHLFDAGSGVIVESVSTAFGADGYVNGPANGTPCEVYVWDDPNEDGDPTDAVLLGRGSGVVANTNTNIFNKFYLDVPVVPIGKFFVGCSLYQEPGERAAPQDYHTPYIDGAAFFTGAYNGSGSAWDPENLSANPIHEVGLIGYPGFFLLRANMP
jgi:hypothetical protein